MSHNADFHSAASKGHLKARETDIVLSKEILTASRTDIKGDLLATSHLASGTLPRRSGSKIGVVRT